MNELQDIISKTVGVCGYFLTADELHDGILALAEAAKDLDPISRGVLKVAAARELRENSKFFFTEKLIDAAFEEQVNNEK